MFRIPLVALLFCLLSSGLKGEEAAARLMLCVDPEASFSAQELAANTGASYIEVEARNPHKALLPICLDQPFVSLTLTDQTPNKRILWRLSQRCGYRYLYFISETLEEAIEQTKAAYETTPKYCSEIFHTPLEDSQKLYSLLEKVDRVLTNNGITFWAGRGTLLGAVRHKGLMPWEGYHTLHCLSADIEKITALQDAFDQEGLVLHYYWKDFYKIFAKDGDTIVNLDNPEEILPFRYPIIDLFPMSIQCLHEAEDTYVHKSWDFFWYWSDEKFNYSQITGITRAPFGPISIPIPSSPETVLNKLYGMPQRPDLWKTHAFEPLWNHKIEYIHNWNGTALVQIDDFAPAAW